MHHDTIDETQALEILNQAVNVRGFFMAAVDIIQQSVETLMKRIFLKDDFAVQSVVGPLLQQSGPLGDLSVRLKLLFGLGALPSEIYYDIIKFVEIRNFLNNEAVEYQFTDSAIMAQLKDISKMQAYAYLTPTLDSDAEEDMAFYQMQQERQHQMLKSGLCLAVIEICQALDKESPF
ncbi:MAG: MltR family transcriptional regulator [Vibrio sp.]